MKTRTMLWAAGCGIVSVLVVMLLSGPITSAERAFTGMKYRLRGEVRPDTNIVLVYVDDRAVSTLGWPVHRNFYALLVSALADLKAAAVGIDVMFEDRVAEYPEYDELLAAVSATAGNVVVGSYFGAVGWDSPQEPPDTAGSTFFTFDRVRGVPQHGAGLHLPFAQLRSAAAGIGHLNIEDGGDLPMFITRGGKSVHAFAGEVLRVSLGAGRMGVAFNGGRYSVERGERFVEAETGPQGEVHLLFPGTFSAFRAYPLLEVLRSYDAVRADRPPSVPVLTFKGKTILVGVVAEGRSRFVDTPVDPRFPALGLHAVFIDNALRSGFLRRPSTGIVLGCTFLIALLCAAGTLLLRRPWTTAFGLPLALLLLSFLLFAFGGIDLPLLPIGGMGLLVGAATLILRQRQAGTAYHELETEKLAIQKQLADRESRVAALETELARHAGSASADRTAELTEELRRYKSEIRELSSRAGDMEPYGPDEPSAPPAEFEGIVHDPRGKMRGVVEFIRKIAESTAPVLVLGESGTGKELVARAIHRRSKRSAGAFIAVNCGALAENLLESELFGHEKGAFTGAVKDRAGRFELADGGTIFLDEIGEVSEAFQLKLLRVLQEGEFERVGGTSTIRVDVRVVAATNKDLKSEVRGKRFREDLYYRLNVLTVALPPLRERKEDVPILIGHFVRREGPEMRLSRNVMEALTAYPWPGNIRELESTLMRAVLLARAERRSMVTIKDIGEEVRSAARPSAAVEEQVLDLVRERMFSRSSITETADELGGLNRGTVAEYLRGEFLRIFKECGFDATAAVPRISLSADPAVNERVRKRLAEYLENIAEAVDRSRPWEGSLPALKPKTKNLPQRYHGILEEVGEAYHRGRWQLTRP